MRNFLHDVLFYILFILMGPWWGIQGIQEKIRQYRYERDFTWEKYWADRKAKEYQDESE